MKKIRIFTVVLLTILIISIAYGASPNSIFKNDSSIKNTYSDNLFVIPIENYGYAPMLKHLIDNAAESIYISMNILSDYEPVKTLLNSLISAHDRGVDVKVVYEGDISSNKYAASYLSEHGVNVKKDNSTIFLHTKLVIIDKKIVYVGSHNWSPYALGKNNEYGILIFNSSIAQFYVKYFGSIWNNASQTPMLKCISETKYNLSITTTYDGYTYNSLKNLMSSAKHRLYIGLYTMAYYSNPSGDEKLVDNLIKIIVEKRNIAKVELDNHDSDNAYSYLKDNNVNVSYDKSYTITHLKLVIADNTVYIGDANWDYTYLDNQTHTVGVIIHNSSIANFFAGYFLTVKKYGDAPYYIPDGFVDTWKINAQPGENIKMKIWIANGGYKNYTTIHLETHSILRTSISQNVSWYRNSVYDWVNQTLTIDIPNNATGTYTVALTFYSKYYHINYTTYIQVEVSSPVPEMHSYIPVLLILIPLILWKKIKKK